MKKLSVDEVTCDNRHTAAVLHVAAAGAVAGVVHCSLSLCTVETTGKDVCVISWRLALETIWVALSLYL